MKTLIVYEKEGFCPQCKFTKKRLDAKGVEYKTVTIDEELSDYFRARQLTAAPIVIVDEDR